MKRNDEDKGYSRNVDLIGAAEAGTLLGLFRCRAERTPEKTAYRQFDAARGSWIDYSWAEMRRKIGAWRLVLAGEGLEAGERVAILHKNSVEWVCFEQAALGLRLVVVPLYHLDTPGNIAFVLKDCGCRLLLAGSYGQWAELAERLPGLSELKTVLHLEEREDYAVGAASHIHFRAAGSWLEEEGEIPAVRGGRSGDLATIIYTSGTTGPAKGVMLSHGNILWNAEAVQKVVTAYPDDVFLSFLPLSHAFERTAGYYVPMMGGAEVAFARSIKDLAEDLLTVRPTVLISVPRVYERMYGRIREKAALKGHVARILLNLMVETGWHRFEALQGRGRLNPCERLVWRILHPHIGAKVLERLGGRLRLAVTGGAPLHEKVGRLFIGLGLPLLQGYGLTENGPVVSANSLRDNLPLSVGSPLPGIEVKLGKDRELLVRSPSVMIGYWNRPGDYKETVSPEGWLHTGDLVEIEEGRIFIRGRLKDIIVTSTGEKIPPADLEMTITEDPLFFQAMVVGEGKPYLAALIVLDRNLWREFAEELFLDPDDQLSLRSQYVVKAVLTKLEKLLEAFPSYARIRAVYLTCEAWTFKEGLVTSLMKLRRQEIEKRFSEEIASLYADHDLPE